MTPVIQRPPHWVPPLHITLGTKLPQTSLDQTQTSKPGQTLKPFFQSKYEQVQKNLGEVERKLEEAQQKIQLNDLERKHTGAGEQPEASGGWWMLKYKATFSVHSLTHSFIYSDAHCVLTVY